MKITSKILKANFKQTINRKVSDPMFSPLNLKKLRACFTLCGWRVTSFILGKMGKYQSTLRVVHNFMMFIHKMAKHHGELFTIKWLKACQISLMKFLARQPLNSLREVEPNLPLPRLSNGLPVIIPKAHRRLIREGNIKYIQLWNTLFSLYRVLKGPFSPKLSTITSPYVGDQLLLDQVGEWMKKEFPKIVEGRMKLIRKPLSLKKALSLDINELEFPNPISTSSPIYRTSFLGILSDLIILDMKGLEGPLLRLMKYFDSTGCLYLLYCKTKQLRVSLYSLSKLSLSELKTDFPNKIGQLAFKEEPAGKLRIFAMVDYWTQIVLKPLHKNIFNFLKTVPNDGTHNQDDSVSRGMEKAVVAGYAYSYDLSSATDRLPIELQRQILSGLFCKSIANDWVNLLVNRDYHIPINKYGITEEYVRYSVGQPMGALSSWAMLALTHHALLQYIWFISNPTLSKNKDNWFTNYEILGDDIIIFDHKIASNYLTLMRALGVEINLSKSLISSEPTFEFAKRFIFRGIDCSALSWKHLLVQPNITGRVASALMWIPQFASSNVQLGSLLLRYPGPTRSKQILIKTRIELCNLVASIYNTRLVDLFYWLGDPRERRLKDGKLIPLSRAFSVCFSDLLKNTSVLSAVLPKSKRRIELIQAGTLDIYQEMIISDILKQSSLAYKYLSALPINIINRLGLAWYKRSLNNDLIRSICAPLSLKGPNINANEKEFFNILPSCFDIFRFFQEWILSQIGSPLKLFSYPIHQKNPKCKSSQYIKNTTLMGWKNYLKQVLSIMKMDHIIPAPILTNSVTGKEIPFFVLDLFKKSPPLAYFVSRVLFSCRTSFEGAEGLSFPVLLKPEQKDPLFLEKQEPLKEHLLQRYLYDTVDKRHTFLPSSVLIKKLNQSMSSDYSQRIDLSKLQQWIIYCILATPYVNLDLVLEKLINLNSCFSGTDSEQSSPSNKLSSSIQKKSKIISRVVRASLLNRDNKHN